MKSRLIVKRKKKKEKNQFDYYFHNPYYYRVNNLTGEIYFYNGEWSPSDVSIQYLVEKGLEAKNFVL